VTLYRTFSTRTLPHWTRDVLHRPKKPMEGRCTKGRQVLHISGVSLRPDEHPPEKVGIRSILMTSLVTNNPLQTSVQHQTCGCPTLNVPRYGGQAADPGGIGSYDKRLCCCRLAVISIYSPPSLFHVHLNTDTLLPIRGEYPHCTRSGLA
jgi:hypothetical protein